MTKRPAFIPIAPAGSPGPTTRRAFLKLMAASAALSNAACKGPPGEVIVPYVRMPENMVPGKPMYFATSFVRRGLAQGVLVETNMGRPTKIEGNPDHPASLGATDVFAQASVLQLWDPDRSQLVRDGATISTVGAFQSALLPLRASWERDGGKGLRILTGPVSSPTLAAQLHALLARYPDARWHAYDPVGTGNRFDAARLAFGTDLDVQPRIDRADIVVSLDADLFGDWPGAIQHARDFTQDRRGAEPAFARRLYVLESTPGVTGAVADNRLALAPHEIERMTWRIAALLGLPGVPPPVPPAGHPDASRWERVLADRLREHRGTSVLVAGDHLSASTQALVHRLNHHLGNAGRTMVAIPPVTASPRDNAGSIEALVQAMHGGAVTALLMMDVNPAYDARTELRFPVALGRVPFSVHLGLYRDETALLSRWHLPRAHDYELWSDARAYDGTPSIVQPVMAPLYGAHSPHELVALFHGDEERGGYGQVRRYWRASRGQDDFGAFWSDALRSGVVADARPRPVLAPPPAHHSPPPFDAPPLAPRFVSDPSVGAGEFANNGWLQELPRPLTGITWDNAALFGTATARSLGLATGDVVRLWPTGDTDAAVEAPVLVSERQAEGVVAMSLGYGRRAAGHVGTGVGFDASVLRRAQGNATLQAERTGARHDFAMPQGHTAMEGRDLLPLATLDAFRRKPDFAAEAAHAPPPEQSLYPPWPYDHAKWGMAIDLNACIGCNACTIACQAENNIPVVGKTEVMRGRHMHWIRVDRYDAVPDTTGRARRAGFQPVPCMHCENAPCEVVCPVGATVHDSEGLNVQVYNRCVGTRFCSNNCPYKVRRFNFLQYANTSLDRPPPAYNPDVTVRRSGVMEKCNYCLQRVTRARIEAEKLGRTLRDGEVVTACQAVCPTQAIAFGNLNDPGAEVNRAKASPRDYTLLAELNTRPRTSYGALVLNPDDDLE